MYIYDLNLKVYIPLKNVNCDGTNVRIGIKYVNAEASNANLERLRVRRQREIYQKIQRFNVVRSIDLRPQRR